MNVQVKSVARRIVRHSAAPSEKTYRSRRRRRSVELLESVAFRSGIGSTVLRTV